MITFPDIDCDNIGIIVTNYLYSRIPTKQYIFDTVQLLFIFTIVSCMSDENLWLRKRITCKTNRVSLLLSNVLNWRSQEFNTSIIHHDKVS